MSAIRAPKPALRRGLTLVELVTSIGIFAIFIMIASTSFIQSLRTQRVLEALIAANGSASLLIEQMGREMRTGVNFLYDPFVPTAITFENAQGETVTYGFSVGAATRDGGTGFGPETITPTNIAVTNLTFLYSELPGYPPRVTILLGVAPKERRIAGTLVNLQTTVSPRVF